MSELKVDKVSPRSGTYLAVGTLSYKNILINGDMSISQRGTSTASITSAGYYACDRWKFQPDSLGTWTMSQDTDVPSGQGFAKSTKLDCTTANGSPSAGSSLTLIQSIEGQMLQYLKKGSANAESLTVSFWVKSNKTGTYIIEFYDADNARSISRAYTIDSASTWEKKTVTIPGDTTGAFDNDNNVSLYFQFWLGAGTDFTSGTLQTSWGTPTTANRVAGQVNLADSTSNDFWITGVQLEAGTTASDFEFLPVDVNLARCQRYFTKSFALTTAPANNSGSACEGTAASFLGGYFLSNFISFPNKMRSSPTLTYYSSTNGTPSNNLWQIYDGGWTNASSLNGNSITVNGFSSSWAYGSATLKGAYYIAGHFIASAEL